MSKLLFILLAGFLQGNNFPCPDGYYKCPGKVFLNKGQVFGDLIIGGIFSNGIFVQVIDLKF
jgi:hypothetical protein